jgi:hypothetical protein
LDRVFSGFSVPLSRTRRRARFAISRDRKPQPRNRRWQWGGRDDNVPPASRQEEYDAQDCQDCPVGRGDDWAACNDRRTRAAEPKAKLQDSRVKNVVFIPIDALKRMKTGDSKIPQVIVTLQRGTATTACQYSANNWSNQERSSLEGTTQCDVYEAK